MKMVKTFKGIDVSRWQGDIDWSKVKNNIDFAIIRAGYGNNNIDIKAKNNVLGCEKNNIPYGLYWFSYAYTVEMAINEAKCLLGFVKNHKPLYPLYFDFEYDSIEYAKKNGVVITNELLRNMATAFCEELENNGYYAGIYANLDYVKRMYGEEIFKKYDLWYARWDVDNPDRDVHLWQVGSDGCVDGITGNVDLDVAFIDFPSLIKEKELNGYKKEEFVCKNNCPYCHYSRRFMTIT